MILRLKDIIIHSIASARACLQIFRNDFLLQPAAVIEITGNNNSGIIDRNVFVSAHFIICWLIVVDKWQTLHHTSLIMMGNLRVWSPGFPVPASQYCGHKSNFPLIIVWVRSVSMTLCQYYAPREDGLTANEEMILCGWWRWDLLPGDITSVIVRNYERIWPTTYHILLVQTLLHFSSTILFCKYSSNIWVAIMEVINTSALTSTFQSGFLMAVCIMIFIYTLLCGGGGGGGAPDMTLFVRSEPVSDTITLNN